MLSRDKSEELMLAREAHYIDGLKDIPGVNAEVLAVMSDLYRTGWRDCWFAELSSALDDGK